mmetsp:Transcript_32358/g.42818  ORF Transcript_32358/g.42818 Transcript_32358/m.42818 type:complete len:151 (-) Transcript_32358:216-668(-)|eukprot:CAMPEP_0185570050 /NCGR_PEP_ID=MMETSP0434-20130131/2494_1 /TAXON_ID=626734 ORGANISM="Favella taraikaensis, Strain Fe Narragansett Bay" /NCGR_SAMPLE_ID=MMETSP0434 /ASSEMBLY_ACC=CAM_ASM_000379 /LENGTH=150 /DNA_ID=CAMNT_0028185057 /DNA_START=1113 /DNA_END=1565 /DNA_ORIENTATION=-
MQVKEADPVNIQLLNEVLDTLKFKNGNQQQADGQIAEFMHPNPLKIKEALDKEKEVQRKLNYSGVVPMDKSGQYPNEPSRLLMLQGHHGIKNSKKQPPRAENIYYQALMKNKEDEKNKQNDSKRTPAPGASYQMDDKAKQKSMMVSEVDI